ncbi:MAG: glycosyltransferase family 2 protein [Lachnospiraceae bacterium]|nr:glycosyltransferase family 2 protein [Lachnospiraceae bacterium]
MPAEIVRRLDIKVFKTKSRGVALNRNRAASYATAPYCLCADNDVIYRAESLSALIQLFDDMPQADVICCRSTFHGKFVKPFPSDKAVSIKHAPKGWYPCGFEMAYRRESPAGSISFNENFGVGAPIFKAGEEDVWLCDALNVGARIYIVPLTICEHDHSTTCDRHGAEDWFIMTGGALHSHLHPHTWLLRRLVHALRQKDMPRFRHFCLSLQGAKLARHLHYFSRS